MGVINNIKFYNNTPTFHIKITSGIGRHGNSNHTENFATVEYVNNELDKKTDKTYVDLQDVLKVDKTTTVNGKELSTDIEIGIGDIAGLETTINTKADKIYVDNQNALKADKTYVDSQDELKADKTYVDTELSLKENIVDNNQKLALKANKSDVDNELALKADKAYVDSQDELKANKSYVDNKLTTITDTVAGQTVLVETKLGKDEAATIYETKNDATSKLLTKVDKTQKIIGIDLQDDILLTEFKTALGNATQSVAGLLSAEDKSHLDGLVALLENDDSNTVVDTIGEILAIFNNYPEGADLVTALNGKVDKVVGKGLSTNDYTDEDKQNVEKIPTIEQDILDLENDKANKSDTYTKSETDTKLQALDNKKLNITDFDADRTIINNELIRLDNDKADKSELFSGDYDDLTNKPTLFSGSYNDLADKPNLNLYETKVDASSKFETAKTYTDTKLTDYYKKVEVDNKDAEILGTAKTYTNEKIDSLIGTAPETYDTLQEIAEYIAEDQTATTAILNEIATVKTNKVDKTTYNADKEALQTDINSKVEQGVYDDKISEIEIKLDEKADSSELESYFNKTEINSMLDVKVDKIEGKGLSTEDYTTNDKNKLDGIEAGAEINPYSKTQLDGFFNGKVDKVSGKGLSTNDYTTTEKNKLAGIETGAQVNRPIATTEQAQLGTDNTTVMTPLGVKTNYYNRDEMDTLIDNLEIDGGFL